MQRCSGMPFDDQQTFLMLGAAFEVHNRLGRGFLEKVYAAAYAIELRLRGIPFRKEVGLPISYKGELLPTVYQADFVCFDEVIGEIKALKALGGVDEAQAINYLRASGLQRALVLNFGAPKLQFRRIVVDLPESKDPRTSGDPTS